MHGKLIVIEGLDGCGKSTQLELLKVSFGENFRFISFPNYDSSSGEIIKEYLSNGYNETKADIGCYSASSFYAIDRYISYKKDWSVDYLSGKDIIAARYTSSNAIYQMAKLSNEKWDEFLDWLYDYEFKKLGIPIPDKTLFLDMPIEISQRLLALRYNGDDRKKDIHEKNTDFMKRCREAALYVGEKYKWTFIKCSDGEAPLSIETVNKAILKAVVG